MENVTLIDCTLRDGGYYTNWSFELETVNAYLDSCAKAGIEIVEIGLRTTASNDFFGPYAYSTDDFLNTLNIPNEIQLGVMINAKDYILESKCNTELLNRYFQTSDLSPVKIVRIAAHFGEVPQVPSIAKVLLDKGYRVGVNLMQSGSKSDLEIESAVKILSDVTGVEVLYFADSMGNMRPERVEEITATIKKNWNREIGIHAHDNMGNALQNSIAAFKNNVTWLDGTILGMGRGAGNTRMEHLIGEINKLSKGDYQPEALYSIVLDDFKKLQDKYSWGPSLLYYLSAEYNIHPTFVQEMLSYKNLSPNQMITALKSLKNNQSYSYDKLKKAIEMEMADCVGDWDPSNELEGREVLLVANGPTTKKYKNEIINFIQKNKPYVISLNSKSVLDEKYLDAYSACHPMRILLESDTYDNLKKPIILPKSGLKNIDTDNLKGLKVLNFGLKVGHNNFEFDKNFTTVPELLVLAYSLGIATSGKSSKIFMVGFDGHQDNFRKHNEVEKLLSKYRSHPDSIELISLTPTTYTLTQSTIYFPR